MKKNNKISNFKNLKIKDLTFKYKKALKYIRKNLNIEIFKKDCIGIIGESGQGKLLL